MYEINTKNMFLCSLIILPSVTRKMLTRFQPELIGVIGEKKNSHSWVLGC